MSVSLWKELSQDPRAAAAELLRRIAAIPDAQRRAALAIEPTDAGELADRFEKAMSRGGPLAGVPFWVKDLFDVAGLPTRAGSSFLADIRPIPRANGRCVQRFLDAGAVCAGKTHLHEFAYGLSGENPHYGDCYQFRHPDRLTGGSSSGSAFAVQAGLAPFALGTDTGGSIRLPAAFCGLHGFRLVPGAPSIADAFPLAHSFDTAGWFTNSAQDMAAVWRAWFPKAERRNNPRGAFLLCEDFGDPAPEIDHALHSLCERFGERADRETRSALLGAWRDRARAFAVLQSTEAYAIHQDWMDTRRDQYDPEVWARLDRGRNWTSADRTAAAAVQQNVKGILAEYFRDFDFLALPIAPFPAHTKADSTQVARDRILSFTTPASLAGSPLLAIPAPLPNGLHTAVQIIVPKPDAPTIEPLLEASAA
jgi:amidase/aspartyl-tRNA(Asn)/glutamyl-tRNA(Gln) amidotransferase subunit A